MLRNKYYKIGCLISLLLVISALGLRLNFRVEPKIAIAETNNTTDLLLPATSSTPNTVLNTPTLPEPFNQNTFSQENKTHIFLELSKLLSDLTQVKDELSDMQKRLTGDGYMNIAVMEYQDLTQSNKQLQDQVAKLSNEKKELEIKVTEQEKTLNIHKETFSSLLGLDSIKNETTNEKAFDKTLEAKPLVQVSPTPKTTTITTKPVVTTETQTTQYYSPKGYAVVGVLNDVVFFEKNNNKEIVTVKVGESLENLNLLSIDTTQNVIRTNKGLVKIP